MSGAPAQSRIVSAFVELLQNHNYSELTITDIAKKANVSRMTFYRNFTDKKDVILKFIESVVSAAEEAVNNRKDLNGLKEYFEILFAIIGKYSRVVYQLYISNFGDLILTYLNRYLFKTPLKNNSVSFDRYKSRFFTGAFYNVMIDWIVSGMKESPEAIAGICSSLTVA